MNIPVGWKAQKKRGACRAHQPVGHWSASEGKGNQSANRASLLHPATLHVDSARKARYWSTVIPIILDRQYAGYTPHIRRSASRTAPMGHQTSSITAARKPHSAYTLCRSFHWMAGHIRDDVHRDPDLGTHCTVVGRRFAAPQQTAYFEGCWCHCHVLHTCTCPPGRTISACHCRLMGEQMNSGFADKRHHSTQIGRGS